MRLHALSGSDVYKTLIVGVVTAVITAVMMFIGIKSGVSPLPKPLALAFAKTLLGHPLPLPVGFVFHAAWVTFFTFVYVMLFRPSLRFLQALGLAFLLWLSVLLVFFPLVGWGFLGLAIGPKMLISSGVPHILFALLIWGGSNLLLGKTESPRVV